MEMNTRIKIKVTTLFVLFVLSTILNAELTEADAMKNQYIQENTPVFRDSFLGFAIITTCSYQPIASLMPVLQNGIESKYNLYTFQPFLGYSKKGSSSIQLTIFDPFYYQPNFGEPIPLEAGVYIREDVIQSAGKFKAIVIIEETEMDVGVESSGYTRWDTKYKPEKAFLVIFKSFEMISECWGSNGLKDL